MTGSGDDDKTRFAGTPLPPSGSGNDDPETDDAASESGTTYSPSSPPPDDERTRFIATTPPGAGGDDNDRTQFLPNPAAPPDGGDDDRTQFAPGGDAPPEDDGRTRHAATPPPSPEPSAPPAPEQPSEAEATGGSAPQPGAVAPTVGVGTLINNNYTVTHVLKSGGMGEVYRGENVFTGDPVAIKVVLPELAEDEKVGLMFKREARTLSQLSDEAIVRYYNFVFDPAINRYCLIMEFISGVPLSDHTAANGPITPAAGKTLLRRLAKGLEKAHGRDVVHRDLSPDNVMLPDGIVSEALLIDFGIAKSNVVKEGTMAGQFAGKFKYVAPEQLGHYGGEIGPATDIYGLALLMAAALIGTPIDMGSSIVEAVQSRQSIPDLSAVPEELRPILAYMLEPDPAARPASMAEVQKLVDEPELIPANYRAGIPLSVLGARTSAPSTLAPGLSLPPGSGLQQPPTSAPQTMPPQDVNRASERRGGGMSGILGLLFLAALGGGGYYAYSEGMLDSVLGTAEGEDGTDIADPGIPAPEGPDTSTREGFLVAFDAGRCTFASRIAAGRNAGQLQGFAAEPGLFAGLPTAYEEAFGARPDVIERGVTEPQCAALEFMDNVAGRAEPVQLVLDADELVSGQGVDGRISDPLSRNIWLVLVSPDGQLFNLTGQLSDKVDGRQTFRFGLRLAEGMAEAPQLILAIASPSPLVSAAAARDGSLAADILPAVADELERQGAGFNASIAYLRVVAEDDMSSDPLTPEGYDFDAASEAIRAGVPEGTFEAEALVAGLLAAEAQEDPEALRAALDAAREALGLDPLP